MTGLPILRSSLPLLAAFLLLLACNDQATVAGQLASAEEYSAEGDWNAARIELANALRLDPKNADINLRLARVEKSRDRWGEALFYFEEAYRLDPDNVDAAVGIVEIVLFADPERARTVVAEITERQPSDPRVHTTTSAVALVEEDLPAALISALTAVELDPELAAAQLQLGMVHVVKIRQRLLRKQEVPEDLFGRARTAFERTRELSSDEPGNGERLRAWIEEARLYARWPKHHERIRPMLEEALEDLQTAPDATRSALAKSALKLGRELRRPKLIRWALEATVESDPHDYTAWGDLARNAHRREGKGVEVVERMLELLPDDPRAHAIYARMLAQTGANEQAVAHLEKMAAELQGDVSYVLQRLLELQLRQDDLEGARATQADMEARYPESGRTFQASAQLASAEGDVAATVDWLTRWNQRNENLIALRMLSIAELARGDAEAALSAADRALELARQGSARLRPFLCLRGEALLRLGQNTSGLQALLQARRSVGSYVGGCLEALAAGLYRGGRDQRARNILLPLISETPSREAVLLYARHESERHPARARALLEALVAARPADANALTVLVQMELRAGQTQAAVALARAAVEGAPDSPGMNLLLGRTLASAQQTDEAIEVLETGLERWPAASGTSGALVSLLGRLGRLDEAQLTLEKLHREGNLLPGSRVMLARLRIQAGDDPGGIELLESALEANPDLTAAANDLAYVLARTGGDLERATELAQVARGQQSDSAQIADTLGWIFHRRGLTNAALVQFEEAVVLADPQSSAWATANYHRAVALRALDRNDEAIDAVERALASGTDFPEAKDARRVIQELSPGTS